MHHGAGGSKRAKLLCLLFLSLHDARMQCQRRIRTVLQYFDSLWSVTTDIMMQFGIDALLPNELGIDHVHHPTASKSKRTNSPETTVGQGSVLTTSTLALYPSLVTLNKVNKCKYSQYSISLASMQTAECNATMYRLQLIRHVNIGLLALASDIQLLRHFSFI